MGKDENNAAAAATSVDDVMAMLQNNAARKGGARLKSRNYTITIEPPDLGSIRLAPQAIKLVGVIIADGDRDITEQDLFNLIEAADLGSKQGSWKVFQYYRAKIIEAGFLTEIIVK